MYFFLFSEVTADFLTLVRHLAHDTRKFLTGSLKHKEKILDELPENKKVSVMELMKLMESQIIEAMQKLMGVQFVDKEKESFESLSPQARSFLISQGIDVQGSYMDYLYYVLSHYYLNDFEIVMDIQLAEIAQSQNISIRLLDNVSVIAEKILKSNALKDEDTQKQVMEEEIDSNTIDHQIESLIHKKTQKLMSTIDEIYLSGNEESVRQFIKVTAWLRRYLGGNEESTSELNKKQNIMWFQK